MIDNFHVKTVSSLCDLFSDTTHADDTDSASVDFGSVQNAWVILSEVGTACKFIANNNAPCCRHQKSECHICRRTV